MHLRDFLPGLSKAHITSSQTPPSHLPSINISSSTFHSRLKTHFFHKSFPPQSLSFLPHCLHGSWTCNELSGQWRLFVLVSSLYFVLFLATCLSSGVLWAWSEVCWRCHELLTSSVLMTLSSGVLWVQTRPTRCVNGRNGPSGLTAVSDVTWDVETELVTVCQWLRVLDRAFSRRTAYAKTATVSIDVTNGLIGVSIDWHDDTVWFDGKQYCCKFGLRYEIRPPMIRSIYSEYSAQ